MGGHRSFGRAYPSALSHLLLALASKVILGSESHGTPLTLFGSCRMEGVHDHAFYFVVYSTTLSAARLTI
jgi:hypothetical protein